MITQDQLKKLFRYNSELGCLYWVKNPHSVDISKPAGKKAKYIQIGINKKRYLAHRLIFLLHNGYLPDFIDHIDGDRFNNKIENLRECTLSENSSNSKLSKRNSSGFKGVGWDKLARKWKASLYLNGKTFNFGSFDDPYVAGQVVRINRIKLHGEFANHG